MNQPTINKLIKEADRLFSLLVRQDNAKDGLAKCVTCGKLRPWRCQHLGHFMPRQHQSTRFERHNTAVQCVGCNSFHEGRQFEFAKYLDLTYGQGTAERMLLKSKMACKRTSFDLKFMIAEFKAELQDKGFEIR